jgi:hypothetical protein
MKILSILYLAYLAYRIATSLAPSEKSTYRPMSFFSVVQLYDGRLTVGLHHPGSDMKDTLNKYNMCTLPMILIRLTFRYASENYTGCAYLSKEGDYENKNENKNIDINPDQLFPAPFFEPCIK